jgi:hypothetical protein
MMLLTSPSITKTAGTVATIAFAASMLLQLLLAIGVVPITMAWGGTQTVLTVPLRVASLLSVVVLGLFAYVIRRRAGLMGDPPIPTLIKILSWVITLFLALNTLGNFASKSVAERAVFGTTTFILVVACLLVSLSRADG